MDENPYKSPEGVEPSGSIETEKVERGVRRWSRTGVVLVACLAAYPLCHALTVLCMTAGLREPFPLAVGLLAFGAVAISAILWARRRSKRANE